MDGSDDLVPCEDFATCGVAQFQNKQFRKNAKQQDSYFIVEDLGATFGVHPGGVQHAALYGVVDGHGEFGEVAAHFIRRNLPPQLAKSPHFAAGRLDEALREAFSQTELLQQAAGLPLWASGACVTTVLVAPAHIIVANCGDCRCVLAERGAAQDLSQDHNVEHATPEELRRILDCGGAIMPDKRVTVPGGPGRLAATRSLGDYWAKQQGPPERHVISGLPELRVVARRPGQQYLVLASDGIFGFMSSQDAVTLCLSAAGQLAPKAPLSSISHTVVCTAVNARHSDDNCTCLVVDLTRIEGSFAAPSPAAAAAAVAAAAAPDASLRRVVPSSRGSGSRIGSPMPGAPQPSKQLPGHASPSMNSGGTTASPPMLHNRFSDLQYEEAPRDESDAVSLSSLVAPDEVCWCPWCWRMNQDGEAENVVLGSFEKWRSHMHEQHFDKLGAAYGPEEVVPCYWCCKPCATKEGQCKASNRLPFWGSHERVCRDNPNKPGLPGHVHGATSSAGSMFERAAPRSHEAGSQYHRPVGRQDVPYTSSAASTYERLGPRLLEAEGNHHRPLGRQDVLSSHVHERHSSAFSVMSSDGRKSRSHSEVAVAAQPPRRRPL